MKDRSEWINQAQVNPLSRLDANLLAQFSSGSDQRRFVLFNGPADDLDTLSLDSVAILAREVSFLILVYSENLHSRLQFDRGKTSLLPVGPDNLVLTDLEPCTLVSLHCFPDHPGTFHSIHDNSLWRSGENGHCFVRRDQRRKQVRPRTSVPMPKRMMGQSVVANTNSQPTSATRFGSG